MSRMKRSVHSCNMYDFQPAILTTSKRINDEARRVLYNDNKFVLVRYHVRGDFHHFHHLWDPNLTPLSLKSDHVRYFWSTQTVSLHVDLYLNGLERLCAEPQFVIAVDELPLFCRALERHITVSPDLFAGLELGLSDSSFHQLDVDDSLMTASTRLAGWSPHSLMQKRMLLEPFTMIRGLKTFTIAVLNGKTGDFDARLIEAIKKRVCRLPATMEEVFVQTASIEDRANEAYRAGHLWLAKSLYDLAEEDLAATLFKTENIEGAHNIGSKTGHTYFWMWVRLRSSQLAALLGVQYWEAAFAQADELIGYLKRIKDGRIGITIKRDEEEVKKLYRLRNLAREGMEKEVQDMNEHCAALQLDPNKAMQMVDKERFSRQNFAIVKLDQVAIEALTIRLRNDDWWTQLVNVAGISTDI